MMIHSYRSCVALGYGRPRTPYPVCRSSCVTAVLHFYCSTPSNVPDFRGVNDCFQLVVLFVYS